MSTNCRTIALVTAIAAILALPAGKASAQSKYPSRPIEMIVPFTPGARYTMMNG